MHKYRILFFNLLFLIAHAGKAQQTPSFITDSLDKYIEEGLKDWNIPGLAIAIIKDGKTVVMKGYGVKDIETKEPVDENTLFMIASNTKLFTATAIAQLENRKKLSIDDNITKYIDGYALYDKNATDLVTIRDLLSHRIGTKTFQGDFVFWNGNLSRRQIMYKMRLLKPEGIFRRSYGYCNSCVLTAGEVIPAVSKMPWEVYVYDSLLIPLGMNNTHTLTQGITQRPNVAKPYTTFFSAEPTRVPYDNIDNLGPAASMVSNVTDMSHWLQMQLDSGNYNGNRILPWSVLQRTRERNTAISSTPKEDYGLGVVIENFLSHDVYYHTGGACGFVSNTCFVPDAKLGIVILSNNDNQAFFEALRYQLLNAYFDVPYLNESKKLLNRHVIRQGNTITKIKSYKARVEENNPFPTKDDYTGTYTNDLYGNIEISKENNPNSLLINFKGHSNLKASLQYMDHNEWLLTYNNLTYGIFPIKFEKDNKGAVSIQIRVNEYIDYDAYDFIKRK